MLLQCCSAPLLFTAHQSPENRAILAMRMGWDVFARLTIVVMGLHCSGAGLCEYVQQNSIMVAWRPPRQPPKLLGILEGHPSYVFSFFFKF